MKTVIIEDEIASYAILLDLLQHNYPEIELIGSADTVETALKLINEEKPELVFLDVHLHGDTCFDLLDQLKNRSFEIIFTTSYEEYALKAFRLAAVDYLLKPFGLQELKQAIDKLNKSKKVQQNSIDHINVLLSNIHKINESPRIALPTLNGFTLVKIDDIVRCESDNTYTTFHFKDDKPILVSKTLKACEKMLREFSFFRVHNSSMVNFRYIKEYVRGEGGVVVMEDGVEVGVSRRKKEEFLRCFQHIRL